MNALKKCPAFIIILICICQNATAQKLKDPDYFLVGHDRLPKVFLVGTFHFAYYNQDSYKIDKQKQVDILSAEKQKEIKQLIAYISKFHPTKIAIEATPSWKAMDKYREYKLGKKAMIRDERYQIAFRLMSMLKLDTVYSIDAGSIANDMIAMKDSSIIKPHIDSIFSGYSYRSNDRYHDYYDYGNSLSVKIPLLDYFKFINSPKALHRGYGAYLLGDFKLGEYRGADALAMNWYDRNLRIFRNIQRMTTSSNDRILVLFGSGHIQILDNLLSSSPEYDYIRFNELQDKIKKH